jgi:hypothetical protein
MIVIMPKPMTQTPADFALTIWMDSESVHYCPDPQPFSTPTQPWGVPFVIATGYFDGETDGVLRCGVCGQSYRFQLLDWDEQQDKRLFKLIRISPSLYEAIERILRESYGDHSPRYWVPNRPSLGTLAKEAVNLEIAILLQRSTEPEAVFMTEHIEREILSLALTDSKTSIDSVDWWAALRPRQ